MTHRKYTKELLEEAAKHSVSLAGVLRYLGLKQAGGSQTHIRNSLKALEIDTSHFTGQATNSGPFRKGGCVKKEWQEILIKRTSDRRETAYLLRRALIESGIKYQCVECGISNVYNDKPIRLEVEHLNRDPTDCRKENLAFMCPNCHSQAPSNGISLTGLTCVSEYRKHQRKIRKEVSAV